MTPGPQCPAHAWFSSSQSWSEVQVVHKHPVTLFYCKNAATATSVLIASEAVVPNVTYCSGASSGCIQGSQQNPDQSWNPYKNFRLSGRVTRNQLHPPLLTRGVPFLFCSFLFRSTAFWLHSSASVSLPSLKSLQSRQSRTPPSHSPFRCLAGYNQTQKQMMSLEMRGAHYGLDCWNEDKLFVLTAPKSIMTKVSMKVASGCVFFFFLKCDSLEFALMVSGCITSGFF